MYEKRHLKKNKRRKKIKRFCAGVWILSWLKVTESYLSLYDISIKILND